MRQKPQQNKRNKALKKVIVRMNFTVTFLTGFVIFYYGSFGISAEEMVA